MSSCRTEVPHREANSTSFRIACLNKFSSNRRKINRGNCITSWISSNPISEANFSNKIPLHRCRLDKVRPDFSSLLSKEQTKVPPKHKISTSSSHPKTTLKISSAKIITKTFLSSSKGRKLACLNLELKDKDSLCKEQTSTKWSYRMEAIKATTNSNRIKLDSWESTKMLRLNNNNFKDNSETSTLKESNNKLREDSVDSLLNHKMETKFKTNRTHFSDKHLNWSRVLRLNSSNRIHWETWSVKEESRLNFKAQHLLPVLQGFSRILRQLLNMAKEWTQIKFNSSSKTKRMSFLCRSSKLDRLKELLKETKFKFNSWVSMEIQLNKLPTKTYLETHLWSQIKLRTRKLSKIFLLLRINKSLGSTELILQDKISPQLTLAQWRKNRDKLLANRAYLKSTNLSKFNPVLPFQTRAPWTTTETPLA